ncbi:MAG: hypothetical protein H6509_12625 [Bryobacterales bacterium]|nr:hypothetical protein [Acidobacteriota bacterium]MCB9385452.1 hypothetical protein [Bryobacterales bacterium]
MAKTTMLFGALLILLGVVGWVGSGMESPTALIPSAFGLLLLIAGGAALNENRRKHAMHGAAMVGLLGFLGSASGLLQLPALLGGAEVARPAAVASKSAMAVLSAIFVALCVRSFIAARKARKIA